VPRVAYRDMRDMIMETEYLAGRVDVNGWVLRTGRSSRNIYRRQSYLYRVDKEDRCTNNFSRKARTRIEAARRCSRLQRGWISHDAASARYRPPPWSPVNTIVRPQFFPSQPTLDIYCCHSLPFSRLLRRPIFSRQSPRPIAVESRRRLLEPRLRTFRRVGNRRHTCASNDDSGPTINTAPSQSHPAPRVSASEEPRGRQLLSGRIVHGRQLYRTP